MLAALGQQDEAPDEVVDVAEAPGLRAVAEHRERLVRERLADEARDRTAVVWTHPGAVCVVCHYSRTGPEVLQAGDREVVDERRRLDLADLPDRCPDEVAGAARIQALLDTTIPRQRAPRRDVGKRQAPEGIGSLSGLLPEPRLVAAHRRHQTEPGECDDEVVLELCIDRRELVALALGEVTAGVNAVALAVTLEEPFEPSQRQSQNPTRNPLPTFLEAHEVQQVQQQFRVDEDRGGPIGAGRRVDNVKAELRSDDGGRPSHQLLAAADRDECVAL